MSLMDRIILVIVLCRSSSHGRIMHDAPGRHVPDACSLPGAPWRHGGRGPDDHCELRCRGESSLVLAPPRPGRRGQASCGAMAGLNGLNLSEQPCGGVARVAHPCPYCRAETASSVQCGLRG